MTTEHFLVDSKLLRELGERLVGLPHIALAELVKNSYDADANHVIIRFDQDTIEVVDDGHGMSPKEFRDHWLRIGTTHKEQQEASREFGRPLTGSKGVGRLSVQLLADDLELVSVSDRESQKELRATLSWPKAIEVGLLTEAPVDVEELPRSTEFANGSPHGTKLNLTGLSQKWDAEAFADLAREIWPLQPPFDQSEASEDSPAVFRVTLESPFPDVTEAFDDQMRKVLALWTARLTATLLPASTKVNKRVEAVVRPRLDEAGIDDPDDWDLASDFAEPEQGSMSAPARVVRLALEFPGERPQTVYYRLEHCHLDELSFEIRVFTLSRRQPYGIRVEEARNYLRRFGGVHVYDASFHLPYYGPDTDWLHVEMDHSHRLSKSRLLPQTLQEVDGQRNLPTNSRLFGVVRVNTTHEQRIAAKRGPQFVRRALAIQVSRDRLAGSTAYKDLVTIVRWALDYYASRETARKLVELEAVREIERPPSRRLEDVVNVLAEHRAEIPPPVYKALENELAAAAAAARVEEEVQQSRFGLLAALATAGIAALAYEHEVVKQFALLADITEKLRSRKSPSAAQLAEISSALDEWADRAKATRGMFSHLLQQENREQRTRFRARAMIEEVVRQTAPLTRGLTIDVSGVPPEVRLPKGGFAEWSAVFQNLFVNAFNATVDGAEQHVRVAYHSESEQSEILVEDTGSGVDLEVAPLLFEPFERRMEISPDRAALGLGGSGLGLTIVRMILEEIGCTVSFVKPSDGFATALRIGWRDTAQ